MFETNTSGTFKKLLRLSIYFSVKVITFLIDRVKVLLHESKLVAIDLGLKKLNLFEIRRRFRVGLRVAQLVVPLFEFKKLSGVSAVSLVSKQSERLHFPKHNLLSLNKKDLKNAVRKNSLFWKLTRRTYPRGCTLLCDMNLKRLVIVKSLTCVPRFEPCRDGYNLLEMSLRKVIVPCFQDIHKYINEIQRDGFTNIPGRLLNRLIETTHFVYDTRMETEDPGSVYPCVQVETERVCVTSINKVFDK